MAALLAGCAAPTAPSAQAEANKALVLHWLNDGDNKRQFDVAYEVFAPDVVMHHPTSPTPIVGVEAVKAGAMALAAAFEGYQGVNHDVIAEGDKVVVRWSVRGKHTGAFMGVPASGNQVDIPGISIYQVRGGKIVEAWYSVDMLDAMRQLGALPAASPAPTASPAS